MTNFNNTIDNGSQESTNGRSLENMLNTMKDFGTANKTTLVATGATAAAVGLGYGVYRFLGRKKEKAQALRAERMGMVAVVDHAASVTKVLINKELVAATKLESYKADLAKWETERAALIKKIDSGEATDKDIADAMALSFVRS